MQWKFEMNLHDKKIVHNALCMVDDITLYVPTAIGCFWIQLWVLTLSTVE